MPQNDVLTVAEHFEAWANRRTDHLHGTERRSRYRRSLRSEEVRSLMVMVTPRSEFADGRHLALDKGSRNRSGGNPSSDGTYKKNKDAATECEPSPSWYLDHVS